MSDVIIGDILPYTQATAIASQTVFGTNWTANYYTDVVVFYTPLGMAPDDATQQLTSMQFSVAFIGGNQEVQITLVTPANAGDIVTITRMTPAARTNLYSNTNFTPSMLNNDFGILTLVDQQAQLVNQLIAPRYNYSAVIAPNASFPNANIILPILLPNQVWVMNSAGTMIEGFEIQTESTGTVEPGLANQLAYYAEDGDVVSGLPYTTQPNYVLTSVFGGPPTWQPASAIGTVITIDADSGSATPTLGIINLSGGSTGLTTVASGNTVDLTGTLAIGYGGTGVNSVTIAPTATAWAGWDANKNFSANNFLPNYATTVTAATTTTLTNQSGYAQFFTGSTTQSCVLPVTSTLALGFPFYIVNNSSGNVTVKSSGGNTVQVMASGTTAYLTCILTTGTTAASWNCEYAFNGGEGSGTVNSGTQYDLAYYATTGTAVSALTTANNSVLVTSSGGVPSLSTTLPNGISATTMKLTTPELITAIYDTNGNELLAVTAAVPSAVNYIGIANASAGNSPGLEAAGTDTNVIFSLRGQGNGGCQIQATGTNASVGAGFAGQFISSVISSGAPTSFSSGVVHDLTSVVLTGGNWLVFGNITFSGTTVTTVEVWTSQSSATSPDTSLVNYIQPIAISTAGGLSVPTLRYSLSSNTTIYISGIVTGTGTLIGTGGIYAVRLF